MLGRDLAGFRTAGHERHQLERLAQAQRRRRRLPAAVAPPSEPGPHTTSASRPPSSARRNGRDDPGVLTGEAGELLVDVEPEVLQLCVGQPGQVELVKGVHRLAERLGACACS